MELSKFKALNDVDSVNAYISALEAFDGIAELQELKDLARVRGGVAEGKSILDVGCGFGLETRRLAEAVGAQGSVCGLDKSADFITEAQRRAEAAGQSIDYQTGDAAALPFGEGSFDCVRAERILIYLSDFSAALSEMRRVLKPSGKIAMIEPDFSTNTINISNRALARRVLDHEIETAVENSFLPGPLVVALGNLGFANIEISSRALIFPQDLAASYFSSLAVNALKSSKITTGENEAWQTELDDLKAHNAIFATISYFLFTADAP
ncbi:methyltransferase domain-containing protein [Roseibium alexandrii]|uniref:methyltransferase domain-containing protein n=1 Tax=Roseibium alexandrii TaxID=388408 RepID=UPI003751505A